MSAAPYVSSLILCFCPDICELFIPGESPCHMAFENRQRKYYKIATQIIGTSGL